MKPPLFLLLCAASLVAGFPIGRALTPAAAEAASSTAVTPRKPDRSEMEGAAPPRRQDSGRMAERLSASSQGGTEGLADSLRASLLDPALRACLMETWRRKDPARLLRALEAQMATMTLARPQDGDAAWIYATALDLAKEMAVNDTESVLRIADGSESQGITRFLAGAVVASLFEHDAGKALEVASRFPGVRFEEDFDRAKIRITPDQMREIWKLPRSNGKEHLLADALSDNFTPLEAMDLAGKESGFSAERVAKYAAVRLVDEDMEAAKSYAATAESFVARNAVRLAVGHKLSFTNPAAAVEWADQYLSAHDKNRVLNQAASTLKRTDPAAAEAISARVPQR